MIDGQNFFDQLIINNLIAYDNTREIARGRGDDNTTDHFLDYNCIKNYYKTIGIDLSKQQALDTDPKAIQQINFTGNLETQQYLSLLKKQKKLFSQRTLKVF